MEAVLGHFYDSAANEIAKAINPASFSENFSFTAYWKHQQQLWSTTVVLHVHGAKLVQPGEANTPDAAAKAILSQHSDLINETGLLQEHVASFSCEGGVLHPFNGLTTIRYIAIAPGQGSTMMVTRAAAFHGDHPHSD
jgi:hypothetical protein